jgi:hypothetical protein
MRKRLRGAPAMVLAAIALFVALGSGYAIGAGKIKIKTGNIANQAVTNKKIKKETIKGDRIDEASLSGAGTAQAIRQDTAAQVPAASGTTTVLTLAVPAGSYVLNSKAVLAKGGAQDPVQCFLIAGSDQDRSLEAVDAANNTTISNLLVHTFTGNGTVTLACDNPGGALLLVTNKAITATPVGAIKTSTLP